MQAEHAGLEDAVSQLRALLEKDPTNFASDDSTRAILENLNKQVAMMYGGEEGEEDEEDDGQDQDQDGEEDDEEYDDEEDGEEDEEGDYDDEDGEDGDDQSQHNGLNTSKGSSGAGDELGARGSKVAMPKGPRPYDLWKAAHEVDRPSKEKLVLSGREWETLVSRLNDSSKKKELNLRKAQHKQIADELSGLTFTPHISERSRELASQNKSLPDRVEFFMRKRRNKLDQIRQEKERKEMEQCSHRPDLSKSKKPSVAISKDKLMRSIGHLAKYVRAGGGGCKLPMATSLPCLVLTPLSSFPLPPPVLFPPAGDGQEATD